MCASIAFVIFTFDLSVNTLSLGRFQLNGQNHQVLVNINVPIQIINRLERWLNHVSRTAVNQDVTETLCSILEVVFRFIIPRNNNNGDHCEKLAIMVIDGSLRLGDNILAVSDEFNRRGITLAVVAATILSYEIWNYYRTLARHTGGDSLLLADAPAILEGVILLVIHEEDTLRQAFLHIGMENVPLMVNRIGDMNEQTQTTDDVNDLAFDHGSFE